MVKSTGFVSVGSVTLTELGIPEAPGPEQPIPFSHKHHAGEYQIECLYCHSGTDRGPAAGVPSVETCMGCHSLFPPSYDQEFEGIRDLKQYWEDQEPIPWAQIHRLPEYVQFRHNRHIQAGFECQKCHGAVEEMDKAMHPHPTLSEAVAEGALASLGRPIHI